MGNETHEIYYTQKINMNCVQWSFIFTHNTKSFNFKGKMNYKMQKVCCLVLRGIASSIVRSAAEQLLEEVKAMHIWTFAIIYLVACDLWVYSYFR